MPWPSVSEMKTCNCGCVQGKPFVEMRLNSPSRLCFRVVTSWMTWSQMRSASNVGGGSIQRGPPFLGNGIRFFAPLRPAATGDPDELYG